MLKCYYCQTALPPEAGSTEWGYTQGSKKYCSYRCMRWRSFHTGWNMQAAKLAKAGKTAEVIAAEFEEYKAKNKPDSIDPKAEKKNAILSANAEVYIQQAAPKEEEPESIHEHEPEEELNEALDIRDEISEYSGNRKNEQPAEPEFDPNKYEKLEPKPAQDITKQHETATKQQETVAVSEPELKPGTGKLTVQTMSLSGDYFDYLVDNHGKTVMALHGTNHVIYDPLFIEDLRGLAAELQNLIPYVEKMKEDN